MTFDAAPIVRIRAVAARTVVAVADYWCVTDRWWTDDPTFREYAELKLDDGSKVIVWRERGEAWRRYEEKRTA